jgi:hypothetical protein
MTACGSDNDDLTSATDSPTFAIAEADLTQNFEQTTGAVQIPVSTTLQASKWSVASSEKWCTVAQSPDGKHISVRITASEEVDVRTAVITVTTPTETFQINVSQLGYGPAILLKSDLTEVKAAGGTLNVTVTTNVDYTVSEPSAAWLAPTAKTRAFTTYDLPYEAAVNSGYTSREATLVFSDARTGEVEKAEPKTMTIRQKAREGSISEVEPEGDILVKVIGGEASEEQPGCELKYAYDGNTNPANHYHSRWYGKTEFPVTLQFFFEGNEDMDYILYHTRSGNGNFGEFDLYLATQDEPEYKLYGSYDFKKKSDMGRIDFDTTQKNVTKAKFVVKTGQGDVEADYVSCAEMQFYRKNTDNTLNKLLLTVFTDITCSEVHPDVTDEQIQQLPSYFGMVATALKNGTYDAHEKEFRVQEYQPYSFVDEWADKLMTSRYSFLDNPTGITVNAGDELVILVGDTHGNTVSLQNVGEESTGEYVQTAASGTTFTLQEGVNKITADKTGMLFFIYSADLTSPNAKPIKVHIPLNSGKVAGFFDLKTHQTNERYKELISKSTYKYFCVRGEKIIFYFHRDKLQAAVPDNILSAINLWDDIVGWQQELMGIDDVRPSQVNNHIFAISPEGSFMWASDYRIAFVYTTLGDILLRDKVMESKGNVWGPAHEIGHIHQKAINWPSSTESSNNLFSNYIVYKLGKHCSRGEELSALANSRYLDGHAWFNMGEGSYQSESTEIHCRMNWQLFNYYHRCGYKPDFWQTLFKLLRENRINESNPGEGQLIFAKMACKAAGEDLSEFFETWGFFVPVDNVSYTQYGTYNYNVTQEMIDEAKAYMAQFPKQKHMMQYLEDRKKGDLGLDTTPPDVGYYTQFADDQKITKTVSYKLSGRSVTVTDGSEAVAFELRRDDKLVYFWNMASFTFHESLKIDGAKYYAVQADGTRVEMVQK